MPFERQEWKLYPEDLENEKAIGIKLPFNTDGHNRPVSLNYASGSLSGTHVFESSYSTEEQAISNLINLLLTRKGERIMHPTFGSLVPDFVFEQNDPTNRFRLQESIRADVNYWLPYIILGDLDVSPGNASMPGDPMHAVTISLPFKVTEQGANRTIVFFISGNGINIEVI